MKKKLQIKSNDEPNNDLMGILDICITGYKLIPLMILLLLIYKYFQVSENLFKIALEMVCGKGCSCSCNGAADTKHI